MRFKGQRINTTQVSKVSTLIKYQSINTFYVTTLFTFHYFSSIDNLDT